MAGPAGNGICPVETTLTFTALSRPILPYEGWQTTPKAPLHSRGQEGLSRILPEFRRLRSFRIAVATAAAAAGIKDSTIQRLGRWSRAAFLTFIRTPRQDLANVSASMHIPHRLSCFAVICRGSIHRLVVSHIAYPYTFNFAYILISDSLETQCNSPNPLTYLIRLGCVRGCLRPDLWGSDLANPAQGTRRSAHTHPAVGRVSNALRRVVSR